MVCENCAKRMFSEADVPIDRLSNLPAFELIENLGGDQDYLLVED